MRILAVAVLVMFSGCLSADPADNGDGTGTGGPEDTPGNEVAVGSGTVVASAGVIATSQGGGQITVQPGARLLYVEWVWADPVVDLDGALSSPSAGDTQGVQNIDHTATGGTPGAPDSPHSLAIVAPDVGVWTISMIANGVAANTGYDFAATVFYDTDAVPDGYSAL